MSVSLIAIISIGSPAMGFHGYRDPYILDALYAPPVYATYDPYYVEPYYKDPYDPFYDEPFFDDDYYEELFYEEAYYDPGPGIYASSRRRTDLSDLLLLVLGIGILDRVFDADIDLVVHAGYPVRYYRYPVIYRRPVFIYDPWWYPVRYVNYWCPPPVYYASYHYEPHYYCGPEPVFVTRSFSFSEPRYYATSYPTVTAWEDRSWSNPTSWNESGDRLVARRSEPSFDGGFSEGSFDRTPSLASTRGRESRKPDSFATGAPQSSDSFRVDSRQSRLSATRSGGNQSLAKGSSEKRLLRTEAGPTRLTSARKAERRFDSNRPSATRIASISKGRNRDGGIAERGKDSGSPRAEQSKFDAQQAWNREDKRFQSARALDRGRLDPRQQRQNLRGSKSNESRLLRESFVGSQRFEPRPQKRVFGERQQRFESRPQQQRFTSDRRFEPRSRREVSGGERRFESRLQRQGSGNNRRFESRPQRQRSGGEQRFESRPQRPSFGGGRPQSQPRQQYQSRPAPQPRGGGRQVKQESRDGGGRGRGRH
jgi:hypothetical protein